MIISKEDLRIMLKELNKNKNLINSFNLDYIKGMHLGFKGGIELKEVKNDK